jgi:single-strand DNA-binding protein
VPSIVREHLRAVLDKAHVTSEGRLGQPLSNVEGFPDAPASLRSAFASHQPPKEGSAMNTINLTGRLTQDPELHALPSGDHVCRLRLAVDGMGRGGRDQPGYVNVQAFGKPGEAAAQVLSKGWLVAVDGRLQYGQWETDTGESRHDYEIVGNVEFLTAPRSNGANAGERTHEEIAA